MAKKNFFDKIADGLALGKDDKIRELNEDPKKKDSSEDSKNEKSEEETKDSKEETPKETEDNPESSKEEPKAEAKPEKDEPKPEKSVPEQKLEPAPAPAPAASYTGAGNVTGMSQTSHTVNNIKEQTVHNHYHGSFHDFVKEICDQPVKRSQLKTLDSNQLEAISNVPDLNKFNFVNEEDQVKNAYKEFAAAIIQRCPKLFNELVREHISGAIERDKDLFKFIYDTNEKKHHVERRYVAKKPEYDEGPMTEERAKQFVAERRKAIAEISSEEAAAKVEEKEFIIPKWVEINLDTGSQEILSDEAAAPYEKEWARSHNTVAPTKPEGKKKATKKPKEPEGEG